MAVPRFMPKLVALFAILALLLPATSALAGTTGGLTGAVTDAGTTAPIAKATVTASSPSQTISTATDAGGRFVFVSLLPDTYTLTVEKQGYDTATFSGISVFADQSHTLTLAARKTLQEIAHTVTRSNTDLVRPGITADVYSVNATTADKVSALGGGGSLNQVYSAVATVPGVYVPSGANGWYQTVQIRGGEYDQIGYELDGIPVNRSFDFYPAHTASSLGQQEIQVYTGSAPANSESQGLSGFINQTIKTGTYPGSAQISGSIGAPSFYHGLKFEVNGATPDRNFSYYLGLSGQNQAFRVADQFNGAYLQPNFGTPYALAPCPVPAPGAPKDASLIACYGGTTISGMAAGPGGYVLGAFNAGSPPAYITDRENILNLHFGLPHHNDSGKDDLQLLYDVGGINSYLYLSPDDLGQSLINQNGGPLVYPTGYTFNSPVGQFLPANYASLEGVYHLGTQEPSTYGTGLIPNSRRDLQQNDQAIIKIQYQKNIGTDAYFRLYGYTFYSDYIQNGPVGGSTPIGIGITTDYELSTHTRGISGEFVKQLSKHQLSFQGSFTTASTIRDNNAQWANNTMPIAQVVDSTNPNRGICYNVSAAPIAVSCEKGDSNADPALNLPGPTALKAFATPSPQDPSQDPTLIPGNPGYGTKTCGNGPCALYVTENGPRATYNTVVPNFTVFNLSDRWKANDKLTVTGGLRFDQYAFKGADTTVGTHNFWFNAWNNAECVPALPGSKPASKASIGLGISQPCSAKAGYVAATLTNTPANYTFNELEPRIGATYSLNRDTVVRISAGKFTQPANAAFEQYNTLDQNLPARLLGPLFYSYGFTSPGHNLPPQESYNYDFSIERHLPKQDVSLKVTPFYRTTKNEQSQFFIDPLTGFVSGLNVGTERDQGVELQINKGNFDRDGLSAQLSFTYTDSKIKYSPLSNGSTILSPINNDIQLYNAYTSVCNGVYLGTDTGKDHISRCGTAAPIDPNTKAAVTPSACYDASGATANCAAVGAVANPYWNAPPQELLDTSAYYIPSTPVVSTTTLQSNTYNMPFVGALILNYRKGPLTVTPALQLSTGQRYGVPESNAGIDPGAGCAALAGATTVGDPRYPFAAPGGAPYDAITCGSYLTAIPDVFTNQFDHVGAFRAPTQLLGNVQIAYDASKNVSFILNLANVINQCFGGDKEPWTGIANTKTCSYTGGGIGAFSAPAGNIYNPGVPMQPIASLPYLPFFGAYNPNVSGGLSSPFGAYLTMKVKF